MKEEGKPLLSSTDHEESGCFGTTAYSAEEHCRISSLLAEPLTREDVQTRPGPSRFPVTYISGFKAIDRANKVFGFDGWSSQIVGFDMNYMKENNHGKYTCCFTVRLRITLKNGAFREDVGIGFAESSREAEAIEKSQKEAVTDAYKRTLKNFGVALGLCLYDNDHLKILNACENRSGKENFVSSTKQSYYPRNKSICYDGVSYSLKQRYDESYIPAKPQISPTIPQSSLNMKHEMFQKQLEDSLCGLNASDFDDVEEHMTCFTKSSDPFTEHLNCAPLLVLLNQNLPSESIMMCHCLVCWYGFQQRKRQFTFIPLISQFVKQRTISKPRLKVPCDCTRYFPSRKSSCLSYLRSIEASDKDSDSDRTERKRSKRKLPYQSLESYIAGTFFPTSFEVAAQQAREAVLQALKDKVSRQRIELQYPTLNVVQNYIEYDKLAIFCNLFCDVFLGQSKRVHLFGETQHILNLVPCLDTRLASSITVSCLDGQLNHRMTEDVCLILFPSNVGYDMSNRMERIERVIYSIPYSKQIIMLNANMEACSCLSCCGRPFQPMILNDFHMTYFVQPNMLRQGYFQSSLLRCYPRPWELYLLELPNRKSSKYFLAKSFSSQPSKECIKVEIACMTDNLRLF